MEEDIPKPSDEMTSSERVRAWLDLTDRYFQQNRNNPDMIFGYGGGTRTSPMRYLLRSDLEAVLAELDQVRQTLADIASWSRITSEGSGAYQVSLILNGVQRYIEHVRSVDAEEFGVADE